MKVTLITVLRVHPGWQEVAYSLHVNVIQVIMKSQEIDIAIPVRHNVKVATTLILVSSVFLISKLLLYVL